MSKAQPERIIQNGILEWLALHDIFAFVVKSTGTWDAKEGTFRRPSKYFKRGTADILGIFRNRFLAIEVKSKTGKLSIHQKIFLQQVKDNGGIAIVARSVDDVIDGLKAAAYGDKE